MPFRHHGALPPFLLRRSYVARLSTIIRLVALFIVIQGLACNMGNSLYTIVAFFFGRHRLKSNGRADFSAILADDPPEAEFPVDYLIDGSWERNSNRRIWELIPPGDSSEDLIRRLIMPKRFHDMHFLRLLNLEHLRVDLSPYRDSQPHVSVRILTDAVSFYPPEMTRHRVWSKWLRSKKQWFTLFQAVIPLPYGVWLSGCTGKWRWANFNITKTYLKEQFEGPFRLLEIICPTRPQGFLSVYRGTLEPDLATRVNGHFVMLNVFRLAFLVMLILVCVAQVVLLVICISMLLLQMGIDRARPAGVEA